MSKWLKTIGMAALAGAAQVAVNRVSRQPGAPPVTGGNLAMAAGTSALMAVVAHLMQSPVQPKVVQTTDPDEMPRDGNVSDGEPI